MKLVQKISILSLALTIGCAVSLSVLLYGVATDILTEQALRRVRASAERIESRVLDTTQRYNEWISLIATRTQLRSSLQGYNSSKGVQRANIGKRITAIVKDARVSDETIERIEVFANDGSLVATTDQTNVSIELSPVGELRTVTPNLSIQVDKNQIVRLVVRKALFLGEERIGQVICTIKPSHIFEALRKPLGLGSTEEVLIADKLDDEHVMVLFSNGAINEPVGEQLAKKVKLHKTMPLARGAKGIEEDVAGLTDHNGRRVFASSRIIEPLNWIVVVKVDERQALAPLARFRTALVWFLAFAATAAVAISILFARTIARPIVKLAHAARLVGKGNFTSQVAPEADGEVGELISAFNSMMTELTTSQSRIQEVLGYIQAAEQQTKAVLDSCLDAVVSMDIDGNVLYWNPSAERVFGYSSSELLDNSLVEYIIPPRFRERFRRAFQQHTESGESSLLGKRFRALGLHRDGYEIPVEVVSSVVEGVDSPIITGFIRDLRDEEQAVANRNRLASMVEFSDDAIVSKSLDGTILTWNEAAQNIYGYDAEYAIGKPISLIVPKDHLGELEEILSKIANGEPISSLETDRLRKDGSRIQVSLTVSPLTNDTGEIVAISEISRDVTIQKHQQAQILSSLREKETLLKEIHHRVKNNLQIISSLLSLQSSYVEDKSLQKYFRTSEQRVQSMALVHERLYQSEQLSRIDFSSYIEHLVPDLFRTYSVEQSSIELTTNIEPIQLTIEQAIPCGLLVNELISNALKHAFRDRTQGVIQVDFVSDGGEVILMVSDNGCGFKDDIDVLMPSTLGLELVSTLCQQLNAEVDWNFEGGTRIRVRFAHAIDDDKMEKFNGECEHTSV